MRSFCLARPPVLGGIVAMMVAGSPAAYGGDGPWVAGNGNASIYLGVESQRIERLDVRDGDGGGEVIDVDSGLSTFGVKAIGSVGIRDRLEVEVAVPWYHVQANRVSGPVCQSLALSACDTTETIGLITVRGKGTILDEFYGAPVAFSLGLESRFGHFTSATRARITNVGEGTQDFGVFTSVGRSNSWGANGFWTAYVEGLARYRLSNTNTYTGADGEEIKVPGIEFNVDSKALMGWSRDFGIGPSVGLYSRPQGLDFGKLDLTDEDRFSALKVTNVRIGLHALFRANEHITFTASALKVVYARNNPYTTTVSVGVSHFGLLRKRKD